MSDQKKISRPYDSAFKTLAHECPKLMIPLVNEIFGTTFSGDEPVILLDPKQTVAAPDGTITTREVDSLFAIDGYRKMTVHIECQSDQDETMALRFLEYDAYIAIQNAKTAPNGRLVARFPRSALRGLSEKRANVRKGVERSMGGEILDFPAKRIRDEGRNEGRNEGRAEGELITYMGLVRDKMLTSSAAAARLKMSESEFNAKCKAAGMF